MRGQPTVRPRDTELADEILIQKIEKHTEARPHADRRTHARTQMKLNESSLQPERVHTRSPAHWSQHQIKLCVERSQGFKKMLLS